MGNNIKICAYCGVANPDGSAKCQYCGGILDYTQAESNLNNSKFGKAKKPRKISKKTAKCLKKAIVNTLKNGTVDVAIKIGPARYRSIINGIKYYDYYDLNWEFEAIFLDHTYVRQDIRYQQLLNDYYTAEEIQKSLTGELTTKDVSIILYRAINDLYPAEQYDSALTLNNNKKNA